MPSACFIDPLSLQLRLDVSLECLLETKNQQTGKWVTSVVPEKWQETQHGERFLEKHPTENNLMLWDPCCTSKKPKPLRKRSMVRAIREFKSTTDYARGVFPYELKNPARGTMFRPLCHSQEKVFLECRADIET